MEVQLRRISAPDVFTINCALIQRPSQVLMWGMRTWWRTVWTRLTSETRASPLPSNIMVFLSQSLQSFSGPLNPPK